MRVGIMGLGLIGGSLAKAYQRDAHWTVFGWDVDRSILDFAQLAQAVDGVLDETNIASCDLLLLASYPQSVIDYLNTMAPRIAKTTLVMDCCGTKEKVCQAGFAMADQYGFTFVGGHPMAGTHNSGFKYSQSNLFDGAPMVVVPQRFDDIRLLDWVKTLLEPLRFGRYSVTTAQEHDKMIAFTSQLAHVVSNAYIKSPTATLHHGFSAGSYRDLTRVAWLNPDMWAELFLENRDNLIAELDTIIASLGEYRQALQQHDFGTLRQLLDDGRRKKEEVDGR